ncbi:MAG: putative toxin-antitoxin system toxin component, PIN family [Rhodocyclaceae bacterium]|nr:putative toxin-antitoxin system toxin component, PIN family [Rhodocyclaceae bacterium]MBX3669919.1 putative toxin-antitoxin system toxin component, PIN family [Rhodocyclaceae bacterium]
MKVVLDTNVLVSGIARATWAPGRVFDAWCAGRFELVMADAQSVELRRVLTYPKVRSLFARDGVTPAMLDELLEILRFKTMPVTTDGVVVPVLPPDPGDVYLIQAFVASQAEFLVSGDRRDLLALGLPGIIGVAEFDRRLSALDFG